MADDALQLDSESAKLAFEHGAHVGKLAAVTAANFAPTPSPQPDVHGPPPFGENWSAIVTANMTQVGYDAGLVIVNFTSSCGADPGQQKAKTVYGDFDTVLTRCDLGKEFIIAPPSRGGDCTVRTIGVDSDGRICSACACPFCTRDTNGTYTHGQFSMSRVDWAAPKRTMIRDIEVDVWVGDAVSLAKVDNNFALQTTVAFLPDGRTPAFVNVTHPLWIQTSATITNFKSAVPSDSFDIPAVCINSTTSRQ